MASEAKKPQTPAQPKSQTFSLKGAERTLLLIMQESHQRTFAATLSLIAQESLGYKVTERTQFKINGDFSEISVSELTEEQLNQATQGDPSTVPQTKPSSGVVAAS